MTNQTLSKGTEVLQKYDYGYGQIDGSGNVDTTKNNGQLGRIESHIGTAKQWTQKFSYDSIGRLKQSEERRGDTNALSYKQVFDFDRFGNMYRRASSNPTTGQENPLPYSAIEESDISKSTNRFTTGTTYDEAGQVTTDNKFRTMGFSYDANGRMIKATKPSTPDALSVYDASGMRVAEKVNDVWRFLIYDIGGKLVAEYGGINGTDEGGVKYLQSDWQGSTRTIVSNSGYVLGRNDFTAYGEEIASAVGLRTASQGFGSPISVRQKYGLTERDDATGTDHTWFRKHENRAGRWTSPDPYGGSMSLDDPQSHNRYSYVVNQPINFIDPSGLTSQGFGSPCTIRIVYTDENGSHEIIIQGVRDEYGNCQDRSAGTVQVYWKAWDWSPSTGRWNPFDPSGGMGGSFGGGGGGVRSDAPNQETPPRPCKQEDANTATLDINLSFQIGSGIQVGFQINDTHGSFYIGAVVGVPRGPGISVTGSKSEAAAGTNYNTSAAAVAAFGYGGKLNIHADEPIREAYNNGSVSFGAGTPNLGAGVFRAFKFRHSCK